MSRNLQLATSAQCKQAQRNLVRLILHSVSKKMFRPATLVILFITRIRVPPDTLFNQEDVCFHYCSVPSASGHWVVGFP